MFGLFYGFWQLLFRKDEYNILILGVDGAGKTSVLTTMKQLLGRRQSGAGPPLLQEGRTLPTVGLNIGTIQLSSARLTFWDLGGQKSLRSIWEKYFAEAHALLYVIDSADDARFDDARLPLQGLLSHPDMEGVPLLLFANKQDIHAALSPGELETRLGLQQVYSSSQPRLVVGTRALDGVGIEEGVMWLVDRMQASSRHASGAPTPKGSSWPNYDD